MDEKYKMVLNEANELKINISSCQEDDTECLQTLIKEYTEAFNNAKDLGLNTNSCRSGDTECLQNLINDSIIIDR